MLPYNLALKGRQNSARGETPGRQRIALGTRKSSKNKSGKSNKIPRIIQGLILLLALIGLGCTWVYVTYQDFIKTPLNLGETERIIQVAPGSSAKNVVHQLGQEKIIEHEWMMRWLFHRSGLEDKLQPGTVILTPDMTPEDLPQVLAKVGKYARKSVQILSGMNLYDIADRLQEQRIADKKQFLKLAFDPAYAAESGIPAKSFEGYILPGAYTFEAGTTTEAILTEMHDRWMTQWRKITTENRGAYERALKRVHDDHALVTLASVVEKEAVMDDERPVIARVFYNRIRKQMMLQSDPTCIYPPKKSGEKPTPARCRDKNNPYSTYVHKGLPPGPISMPSVSSLKAVILPYDGPDSTEILYFVARQDGSWRHYFSRTYAEHQVAVDYFLKGKKSKKPGNQLMINQR